VRRWLALVVLLTACGGDGGGPADAGGGPDGGADASRDAGAPATILPAELADERALDRLAGWQTLPALGPASRERASSTDRGRGEPEIALLQNGNRDMNNFVCASEDAEIAEPHLVEPVFDLPECPEPWVKGVVLGRFAGSGTLDRFWLTAFSLRAGPADREILRIYVDDETEPVLQVPLADLLDGSAGEMFAPPFGAGATTHLAWYYPVVFGTRLVVTLDRLGSLDLYYYQLDASVGPPEPSRVRASSRLDARDDVAALLDGAAPVAGEATGFDGELVLARPSAGTLRELRIRVADAAALADLRLTAIWDASGEPAIELSLAELFAAADAVPEGDGLVLSGAADGAGVELALRLPMPFRESALVELSNTGDGPVTVDARLTVDDALPAEPFGLLHAQRHETTEPSATHPIASATGPGRLAGTCLMLAGHALDGDGALSGPFNFLEGDETLVLDGRTLAGTGTEDYLNGAFYFLDGPFSTPFARVWGITEDDAAGTGRVTACRWHVLGDVLDFDSAMSLELEVGPAEPSLLDRYVTIAWLYL